MLKTYKAPWGKAGGGAPKVSTQTNHIKTLLH